MRRRDRDDQYQIELMTKCVPRGGGVTISEQRLRAVARMLVR